jgi:hypothetical protein
VVSFFPSVCIFPFSYLCCDVLAFHACVPWMTENSGVSSGDFLSYPFHRFLFPYIGVLGSTGKAIVDDHQISSSGIARHAGRTPTFCDSCGGGLWTSSSTPAVCQPFRCIWKSTFFLKRRPLYIFFNWKLPVEFPEYTCCAPTSFDSCGNSLRTSSSTPAVRQLFSGHLGIA